jgi:hypothetical protein
MSKMPKPLHEVLTERVVQLTGRRVRDLTVAIKDEEVILSGTTESFHVKQLAIQGVREVLPRAPLRNAIVVA